MTKHVLHGPKLTRHMINSLSLSYADGVSLSPVFSSSLQRWRPLVVSLIRSAEPYAHIPSRSRGGDSEGEGPFLVQSPGNRFRRSKALIRTARWLVVMLEVLSPSDYVRVRHGSGWQRYYSTWCCESRFGTNASYWIFCSSLSDLGMNKL
jgi:hypothetical protein